MTTQLTLQPWLLKISYEGKKIGSLTSLYNKPITYQVNITHRFFSNQWKTTHIIRRAMKVDCSGLIFSYRNFSWWWLIWNSLKMSEPQVANVWSLSHPILHSSLPVNTFLWFSLFSCALICAAIFPLGLGYRLQGPSRRVSSKSNKWCMNIL